MLNNFVAVKPEDVEANLGAAKIVITLCDHIVAISEDPHRVNGGCRGRVLQQVSDAARAVCDREIMLRVASGIDVGESRGVSRFETLQELTCPLDLLIRAQLLSESVRRRNQQQRKDA